MKSKGPFTHVKFFPHDWNLAECAKLTRASRTNWSGSKEDISLHGFHGFTAYTRMTIVKYNIGRVHGPYQSTFIMTAAILFNKEFFDNLGLEITLYCITIIEGGRSWERAVGCSPPQNPKGGGIAPRMVTLSPTILQRSKAFIVVIVSRAKNSNENSAILNRKKPLKTWNTFNY